MSERTVGSARQHRRSLCRQILGSRFKSQALLDEAGLLTAMAYVDLNPIRAGIAITPESSEFTSIYDRIKEVRVSAAAASSSTSTIPLRRFSDEGQGAKSSIPYLLPDYLALVDWSGRAIRAGKRGFITADLPPIIKRLNIDAEAWELLIGRRGVIFGRAMGRLDALRLHAATIGQSWILGVRNAKRIYSA